MDSEKNNKEVFSAVVKGARPGRLPEQAFRWLWQSLVDQVPLLEAFLIAVSIHVMLFPVAWIMGWALPWPKTPIITTVVEYDLRNWPIEAKQKKLLDVRDPNLNK